MKQHERYADIDCYIDLLQQLDECCNDSIVDSQCNDPSDECHCIVCRRN